MKKKALRTSFRSAIHATDSTCSGCSANKAATNALRQRAPVRRFSATNSRLALTLWSKRLVRWCPLGFNP